MKNHIPSQKMFGTNAGFTLLEILITTVLVFLLFTLIYATFFSVTNVTAELQRKMKSSEILFKFLGKFSEEIKCMILETGEEPLFGEKTLSFVTKEKEALYPVRITYSVEKTPDNYETLIKKQENCLNDYYFSFPVIQDCDSISFLFYTGAAWNSAAPETEKITAVAVEVATNGEKIFLPVKLYRDTEKDEKK